MSRNGNLRLDRILASQPELGPSIPDGGYGWIILGCTIFVQALVPSVLTLYGVLALFVWSEQGSSNQIPRLLDLPTLLSAITFTGVWVLLTPVSQTVVTTSNWPRLTGVAGTCLVCAGLLIQWIALANSTGGYLYILSGLLSGMGCSLLMAQSDLLLTQYFRKKLRLARGLCRCGMALGFIATPIVVGTLIITHGVLRSLLIHQAAILQLLVLVLPYRKPPYLKAERRRYELLQEEDTVYPPTELSTVRPTETLRRSFAEETINEPTSPDISPQLTEISELPPVIPEISNQPNPIEPTPEIGTAPRPTNKFSFIFDGIFYRELIVIFATRFSSLVFFSLFATQLYIKTDLHVRQTSILFGCSAFGILLSTAIRSAAPPRFVLRTIEPMIHAVGAFGHFLLGATRNEQALLTAALFVSLSSEREVMKCSHYVNPVIGILLLIPLVTDYTFSSYFLMAALLHFIAGSILLAHHALQAIQTLFPSFNRRPTNVNT